MIWFAILKMNQNQVLNLDPYPNVILHSPGKIALFDDVPIKNGDF